MKQKLGPWNIFHSTYLLMNSQLESGYLSKAINELSWKLDFIILLSLLLLQVRAL